MKALPILFLGLLALPAFAQKRSTYVIRPDETTETFSWTEELEATELELTPGILLSQDNSQRLKAVLVREGRERDTGVYWGAVNLANSMSERSFLEMMPLEHFASMRIDKTASLKGNAARMTLSKSKPENKFAGEVSDFGQGLVSLSIYDKKDKNHFFMSYLRDENQQAVYDDLTDNYVNQENDSEKYASIGYSKTFKKAHFDLLYSNVEKGIPGDLRNPLNRVTEERSLAILKVSTKKRMGRILHQGEVYTKFTSNRMNDPEREVDPRVKTYQQEETNFGVQTTHKGRIQTLKLKAGVLADHDSIKVKRAPIEEEYSKYTLQKLNPALSWDWDMFKGSHELSLQQLSYDKEQISRVNFSNSIAAQMSLMSNVRVSGSIGMSRTSPLLTEMFGNNGDYEGNPNLQDEQFLNGDFGATIFNDEVTVKVSGFHRLGQNMIANERVSFNKFKPSNIDRVWITGAEVSAEAKYGYSTLRSSATYAETLNDSDSQYSRGLWIPMHSQMRGSLAWDHDWHWFGSTLKMRSWSSFFSDKANQIENPGTTLWDASVRSTYKSFTLEVGVMNMFDRITGEVETPGLIGNPRKALIDHFGNYVQGRHFKLGASYVF
jgi:hypothetical protein